MGKKRCPKMPEPKPVIPMTPENKARIDAMDFEAMLRLVRFAPVGDPLFESETGSYFIRVMGRLREELPEGHHAIISKRIGWTR